ncbi:hypothetical protein ACHAWF_001093 [Thalassiosira exigua]
MVPPLFLLPIVAFASPAESFALGTPSNLSTLPSIVLPPSAPLRATRADLASREYQLEELEDREECETEVWLNDDGSVTLGPSNGPKIQEYEADWYLLETAGEEDRPFRMRLTRRYESPSSVKSNAGDTTYSVKREFWGNVETVGE